MAMSMHRNVLTVAMGFTLASVVACDPGPVDTDDPDLTSQPLAGFSRTPLRGNWNGKDSWWQHPDPGNPTRYTIPVCWIHVNRAPAATALRAHSGSDAATETLLIQSYQATWTAQTRAGVVFDFRGDCPTNGALNEANLTTVMSDSTHKTWVPVAVIDDRDAAGNLAAGVGPAGVGNPGFGNRHKPPVPAAPDYMGRQPWWQVAVSCGAKREDFPAAAVHEFGHMLGWAHEFERADYQPNFFGPKCVPRAVTTTPEPNPSSPPPMRIRSWRFPIAPPCATTRRMCCRIR